MQKVQMLVGGKEALVDADMVNLMIKKQVLVAKALELQENANTMSASVHLQLMDETVCGIIRLNKRIRKNVIFL